MLKLEVSGVVNVAVLYLKHLGFIVTPEHLFPSRDFHLSKLHDHVRVLDRGY